MSSPGKILCVSSNFPRWAHDSTTPFVLNLAEDLCQLGWQVDVLAPHAAGAKRHEVFDKVRAFRFRYMWPVSQQTVCYQGGALVNLRKRPWTKLKLPALVAAQFFSMLRLLWGGCYDIIHAHWIVPQGFNAVLLGRLFNKPVVVTVHGGDVFGLHGTFIDPIKRFILRNASCVTVNSDFTSEAVKKLCPECRSIIKIPMGVSVTPPTKEQKAQIIELQQRHKVGCGPLLIFVGRLVEEKGVGDILQALAMLVPDLPDARLLIVGEGQDRAAFEASAIELNVEKHVQFLGWVEPADVRLYMAAADIFVGPSRTAKDGWIEAQGLTFLEAMASGTTTIGTRLGGIKESIIEGQTGFLVDECAPEQIAATIKKITANPELAVELIDAASARTTRVFSREASAQAFCERFLKLMAG